MIRDVLVHVDSTEGGRRRLRYALQLSSRFKARLTGVHVLAPVDVPPYYKPHAVEEVARDLAAAAREDAAASEDLFRETTASGPNPCRWRSLEGHMSEHVCELARCADLVILGQYEGEGSAQRRPLYLAEEVVLGAGRPVLVVPEQLDREFRCNRVLIGWDATREATRAVHDALPLLVRTKPRIDILSLPEPGRTLAASELADHLGQHGLDVFVTSQARERGSHGEALVHTLIASQFDLLVVGAYAHPVWRELLFGGSTQSVLAHARTPVLISH
ncbi:MAG TPA: universal stress protein [Caulobacteraceae bacterium]|nr:universal stress protein [Caulobacteraceae bacterium]